MKNRKLFTKGLCVVIAGCLFAAPAFPAMAAETATTNTATAAKPATTKSDSSSKKHSSLPPKKSLIAADTSEDSTITDVATPLAADKPAKDNTDGITVVAANAFVPVEKSYLAILKVFGIIIALSIPTFICINKFLFRHS